MITLTVMHLGLQRLLRNQQPVTLISLADNESV